MKLKKSINSKIFSSFTTIFNTNKNGKQICKMFELKKINKYYYIYVDFVQIHITSNHTIQLYNYIYIYIHIGALFIHTISTQAERKHNIIYEKQTE